MKDAVAGGNRRTASYTAGATDDSCIISTSVDALRRGGFCGRRQAIGYLTSDTRVELDRLWYLFVFSFSSHCLDSMPVVLDSPLVAIGIFVVWRGHAQGGKAHEPAMYVIT